MGLNNQGVTGTGSVGPHARHCRAVNGTQSLVSGTCPTQPRALGRWIVRLCHTVPFFWAQIYKKKASKLFLLKLPSIHFIVVILYRFIIEVLRQADQRYLSRDPVILRGSSGMWINSRSVHPNNQFDLMSLY